MLDHTEPAPLAEDYRHTGEDRNGDLAGLIHRWEVSEASSIDEAIVLLAALHKEHPSVPIIVVSTRSPGQIRAEVTHSSASSISNAFQQNGMVGALNMILVNEPFEARQKNAHEHHPVGENATRIWSRIQTLTSQQRVVLRLLVSGKLNKQIAFELNVSMTTVKAHVSAVLTKLGVKNRTQAVILVNKVNFAA
jgi:DNA-binding NarL/FixJ family response regulator